MATSVLQLNAKPDPSVPSSDYKAMMPYWVKSSTILAGVDAMREKREYLPKFPDETDEDYESRRSRAKLTNIFHDIIENLSQRPFSKEVVLNEEAGQAYHDFSEDVDGRGNSLHQFAGEIFFHGIANGLDWILVDYSAAPTGEAPRTRAQERAMGVRPYWVRYPADSVLAAYTETINGREQLTHVRLKECGVERAGYNGWEEKAYTRVRIFNRQQLANGAWSNPTWELWELQEGGANNRGLSQEWVRIQDPTPMTVTEIPMVPFLTGRRKSSGGWNIRPPMQDAAELQVELYQQESGLKNVKELIAFPMLTGNGVSPEIGDDGEPKRVPTGPAAVLYAPPEGANGQNGEWRILEPAAQSLEFLLKDIEATKKELRELGRQPLTAQSGNLTVVTTAFAAQKGNAAIQAWALNLKYMLEEAFRFTGMWMRDPDPEVIVKIDTDFDLGFGDDDSFDHVLKLRENNDISRDAELEEAKRRGILSPDYDSEEDLEKINADLEADQSLMDDQGLEEEEEELPPEEGEEEGEE